MSEQRERTYQDRYHPAQIQELDGPVSLINEPVPPDNVAVLISRAPRPLCAVLIEALNSTEALLRRLEAGISTPTRGQEVIRALYVQTRRQRDALAACLEIGGLE